MRLRLSVPCASAIVIALITVLLLASFVAPASAQTFADTHFSAERVLDMSAYAPEGFVHAPDGRMFIWGKAGYVWVWNGTGQPTMFLDISARVNYAVDRGLLGFALDPNFATNGYFYLAYVYENAGANTSANPRTERVSRFQRDPNNPNVALPGSETVILGKVTSAPCAETSDCMQNDMGAHTINHVAFGPDGKLYVTVGDGATYTAASVQSFRAQHVDSLNGKILRVNPDGTGPSDNPFYNGDPNANRSKVFAYGLRNPFRFSFDAQGRPWIGDVGWTRMEEVNQGRGANFGWPCFEGPSPQPEFQYQQAALCAAIPQSATVLPRFSYDHTVGTCIIGGPVYKGSAYPSGYVNRLFFADYVSGWIRTGAVQADGSLTDVQVFATAVPNPVYLELGPDGMVYYSDFVNGDIMRIRYTASGNRAPVAVASATPTAGPSPLTVNFTGSNSSDPDGNALSYLWNFGDGTTSNLANPTKVYTSATQKKFTATLTVSDPYGASGTASVPITIGNPPVVTIVAPANNTTVKAGDIVNFQGTATDVEDGRLTGASLQWSVFLHHNAHEHILPGFTGETGSLIATPEDQFDTFYYRVVLTATDSSGLQSSQQITLPIDNRPVPCNVNTSINPNVTICWPTEGQQMPTGQVRLLGTAYSSTGIQKIDIYVNGAFNQTVAGNVVDKLLQLNPGVYNVELRATDGNNQLHSATRNFSVAGTTACTATGTAPSITLCSPADGSTVTSPVRVQAAVASNNGVIATKVYVDNVLAYSVNSGLVDTSLTLPSGTHYLVVQFWDNSNVVTLKSATITVSGAAPTCSPLATAPSVNICSPAAGSTVGSPTRIMAAVKSNNGVIATHVYVDNQLAYSVNGPNVDTSLNLAAGLHALTVQFWDNNGNVVKQSETFTVGSATPPPCSPAAAPSITICTPANGASVTSPVGISALISSNNGIVATKIYIDANLAYSTGAGSTVNTSLYVPTGTHLITVQFWDNAGVATKKSVTVNVTGGVACAAPTVDHAIAICSPTNGSVTNSPLRVVAAINSSTGVVASAVYVNDILAWSGGATNLVDTQIATGAGPKYIVVQYWDSKGQYYKQATTVSVQ